MSLTFGLLRNHAKGVTHHEDGFIVGPIHIKTTDSIEGLSPHHQCINLGSKLLIAHIRTFRMGNFMKPINSTILIGDVAIQTGGDENTVLLFHLVEFGVL